MSEGDHVPFAPVPFAPRCAAPLRRTQATPQYLAPFAPRCAAPLRRTQATPQYLAPASCLPPSPLALTLGLAYCTSPPLVVVSLSLGIGIRAHDACRPRLRHLLGEVLLLALAEVELPLARATPRLQARI